MSSFSLMTHLCRVERNTPVNSDGFVSPGWATVESDVPCLMQQKRGVLQTGDGGLALQYDAVVFLPIDVDLKSSDTGDQPDRIIVTDPERLACTLLVQHAADESGMGDHLTAWCRRNAPAEGTA